MTHLVSHRLTRRGFLAGAGAAGLTIGLAACGSDGDSPAPSGAASAGGASPGAAVPSWSENRSAIGEAS
jgi:hypothetical protein